MTDLTSATEKHKYVLPDGTVGVNVTKISGAFDVTGKASAFAGAAVKLAREGKNYRDEWKAKAERGSRIHAHAEAFIRGDAVDQAEDEAGYMDALDKWMVEHAPVVVESEQVVVHGRVGYGGRFDLVCRFGDGPHAGKVALVDYKTGSPYPVEHTLQLAAYRYADIAVYGEDGTLCGTRPMPAIDLCCGLYLSDDGTYRMVAYDADIEAWNTFAMLCEVYRWTQTDAMKAKTKETRK